LSFVVFGYNARTFFRLVKAWGRTKDRNRAREGSQLADSPHVFTDDRVSIQGG
jgi:hypothetical protein